MQLLHMIIMRTNNHYFLFNIVCIHRNKNLFITRDYLMVYYIHSSIFCVICTKIEYSCHLYNVNHRHGITSPSKLGVLSHYRCLHLIAPTPMGALHCSACGITDPTTKSQCHGSRGEDCGMAARREKSSVDAAVLQLDGDVAVA